MHRQFQDRYGVTPPVNPLLAKPSIHHHTSGKVFRRGMVCGGAIFYLSECPKNLNASKTSGIQLIGCQAGL